MRMVKNEARDKSVVNKYNQSKGWENENANPESFISADDSLAYSKPKKYAMFEKQPEIVEEETEVEDKVEKYKKVDYKKRYDDLKRHYDKKVNEFKKELENAKASTTPSYTPPKTLEELEEFKKINPNLYGMVETISHLRSTEELKKMEEELKAVREKLSYEEARAAYVELKALVPDFEQIRQSDDFHSWAEEQPEQIQKWVYENRTDAQLAAKAINLYKADRGMAGNKSKQQPPMNQRAAEAVSMSKRKEEPSSKEKVWTTSEIQSLHWKDFDKYQHEIDRAFAEGRVVQG